VRLEKSFQAELASLLLRKCRAFVQPLVVEEIHPAGNIRKLWLRRLLSSGHFFVPFSFPETEKKLPETLRGI
jgi:hypothetical protein